MGAHKKRLSPRPGSPRPSGFSAKIYRASKTQQAAGSGPEEKCAQGSARHSSSEVKGRTQTRGVSTAPPGCGKRQTPVPEKRPPRGPATGKALREEYHSNPPARVTAGFSSSQGRKSCGEEASHPRGGVGREERNQDVLGTGMMAGSEVLQWHSGPPGECRRHGV